jgi:hypothetical protein
MDKNNKNTLLRIFSLILKNRSKDTQYPPLTLSLMEYYTRKDLIEIIKSRCKDNPEDEFDFSDDQNLVFLTECEKIDLFKLVKDDLYLMAHTFKLWADEIKIAKPQTKENNVQNILPESTEVFPQQEHKTVVTLTDKNSHSKEKDLKEKKN